MSEADVFMVHGIAQARRLRIAGFLADALEIQHGEISLLFEGDVSMVLVNTQAFTNQSVAVLTRTSVDAIIAAFSGWNRR